jgi:origin recognition complex subunit 3
MDTHSARFAEDSLSSAGGTNRLKDMLDSDEVMFSSIKDAVKTAQQSLAYQSQAVQVAYTINSRLSKTKTTPSAIYSKAMAGKLSDSPFVRELLLAVKQAPSNILMEILTCVEGIFPAAHASDLQDLTQQLKELAGEDHLAQPMRSEHDIRSDTLRTTVVAQKVQLSRHKAKLSKKDEAYSKIVTEVHDLLTTTFKGVQNPLDMPAHEIVVYDLRMPHRAALIPKPRFVLERALSSPHDYLNCQCCGAATNGGQHGEVSSLYQLKL